MRTLRQRAGMSQERMVAEGLTRSHVSDLERGHRDPRLSTLFLISRILKIPVAMLVAEIERNYARLTEENPKKKNQR